MSSTKENPSIRSQVLSIFMDNPDEAYRVTELSKELDLQISQVHRAIQFFMDRGIVSSFDDPYAGFGIAGRKHCVYALSEEVHRKVSKQ